MKNVQLSVELAKVHVVDVNNDCDATIPHLAGLSSTEIAVPINSDAKAPIFEFADYGIVGDLFDVVPHVIEEIKRVQSEK